jgi:hypothetical protein
MKARDGGWSATRVLGELPSQSTRLSRRVDKGRVRGLCLTGCGTRVGGCSATFSDRIVFVLMRRLSQRACTDLGDVKCCDVEDE